MPRHPSAELLQRPARIVYCQARFDKVGAEVLENCYVGWRFDAARDQQSSSAAQADGVENIIVLRLAGAEFFAQFPCAFQINFNEIEESSRTLADAFAGQRKGVSVEEKSLGIMSTRHSIRVCNTPKEAGNDQLHEGAAHNLRPGIQERKVRRGGAGLSFFYYAPTITIVTIPIASTDVPYVFQEATSDFQAVTIQGQFTYRVADPKRLASLLDFSIDKRHAYCTDDPRKLPERLCGP